MSNGKWDSLSLFPSLGHGVLYLLLIIFCYLTNYPQKPHLNNKHVLAHTVSMGQKFTSGLAEVVLALGAIHVAVERLAYSHGGRQKDLVPCWQLAGGLSHSANGTLRRAAFHGKSVESAHNE